MINSTGSSEVIIPEIDVKPSIIVNDSVEVNVGLIVSTTITVLELVAVL